MEFSKQELIQVHDILDTEIETLSMQEQMKEPGICQVVATLRALQRMLAQARIKKQWC